MARPKRTADRVATAVRLPRDLHERTADVADERGTSVNHLIVKALQMYLDRLPPLDVPTDRAS